PFYEIKGYPDDSPQNNLPVAITPVRVAGSSKKPFKKVDSESAQNESASSIKQLKLNKMAITERSWVWQ
ncbi:MAG: hypothetical protein PVF71_09470, partial [Desulfobacterales bacterium]